MTIYEPEDGMTAPDEESMMEARDAVIPEPERVEPEAAGFPQERMFAASEREWYWAPLVDAVGSSLADEFDWRAETGTIQTYEHRETFRYVHIDSVSRHFYDQQCNVISQETALLHALPPGLDAAVEEQGVEPGMAPAGEKAVEKAIEPGLEAFTRKPEPSLRMTNGAETQVSQVEEPAKGITRWLGAVKRKMLSRGAGSADAFPGRSVLVGEPPAEVQEPSLTTYTRKKFEYER